jgi:elongation factor Ts
MTITAEQVRQLREQTGAGMMECKKALTETAGNLEKAIDVLRKTGAARAEKRTGREAADGLVESYIHPGNRVGVLVEVNCETDFVARTDEFRELARHVAMQVAAAGAEYLRREDVPAERVEREREIFSAQMQGQGKPAAVIDQIVRGKLDKFYSEVCLLEQPFIRDDKVTIGELLQRAASKTGENVRVRRFTRYLLGQD